MALAAAGAMAQPVYRQVDKNGKVTFSDRAPTASTEPASGAQGGPGSPANAGLPYEIRQVVQRYPVLLYTGEDCSPCGTARTLLVTRGVPFDERTVKSNEDIEALQRLSGQGSVPLLTIGSQQLKGFSDAEWSQYLDAAGYPKSNNLPAGYRNGLARPLVAQQAAPAPRAPATPATQSAPPAPSSEPSPSNPAGIKF
ncbi:glutaredoxin family protein [Variovorax sp. J22G73]|uniref:glutaredoxin family protein n=1 Tax=unclassified Variovorax TaxID=663243 RepID=UPI002577E1A4|nr:MULTISPECIES: glutaredoxin family protein [unclassified Variovorax]MDM0006086.1 glutaredoxin family protein [Variovorax sp. J22R203]MDM0097891.1 glutaredoxin family protein [Variovorax sp. J22G73]